MTPHPPHRVDVLRDGEGGRETLQTWRDQLEAMRINARGRKGMTESELRAEWEALGI